MTKITKKFINTHNFFKNDLENIFEKITDKTYQLISPVLEDICTQNYYLDFTKSGKDLDLEEKNDAYFQCMDYCTDILTKLIEYTLSGIGKTEFILFLCKNIYFRNYSNLIKHLPVLMSAFIRINMRSILNTIVFCSENMAVSNT